MKAATISATATRLSARIGAIVSGPLIAFGSLTVLANRGIFLACAVVTAAALLVISAASRVPRQTPPGAGPVS
jgi:hypothetical protein